MRITVSEGVIEDAMQDISAALDDSCDEHRAAMVRAAIDRTSALALPQVTERVALLWRDALHRLRALQGVDTEGQAEILLAATLWHFEHVSAATLWAFEHSSALWNVGAEETAIESALYAAWRSLFDIDDDLGLKQLKTLEMIRPGTEPFLVAQLFPELVSAGPHEEFRVEADEEES